MSVFARGKLCPGRNYMDYVVSTIFHNGQFWIALIEKQERGRKSYARYVFGHEPTNPQLIDFYSEIYPFLRFVSEPLEKIPKLRTKLMHTASSHDAFKIAQEAFLKEKKKARKVELRASEKEKYRLKAMKKKEKKRGH
jgi:hypothetical protein